MKLTLLILFLLFSYSCAHKKSGYHELHKIVQGTHRSQENIIRNTYRHPVETLDFFEIKPNHKVVEVNPSGGWYTEILGPYLKDSGELYLAAFSASSKRSYAPRLNAKLKKMTQDKTLFGKIHFTVFEAPDNLGPIAPDNSVDRVLTFRNIHNWMKDGKAQEAFKTFFKALKPGGVLGVVEHRAKPNKKQDPKAISGYVREDFVIDLALKAGFEFIAKSEINANYNDNSNHKKGVWTLPPSLRLGDKNKSSYLAIGESDRMTIKFIKPLK